MYFAYAIRYNRFIMFVLLLILTIITFLALLIVAAVRPSRSQISLFELDRRSKNGDKKADYDLKREKSLADVMLLVQVLSSLLLVIFVSLSVLTFGWLIGIGLSLVVTLGYVSMAGVGFIKSISGKIYNRAEDRLLVFVQKDPFIIKVLRSVPGGDDSSRQIGSRQELQHLIANSENILTPDEKKLVTHSLSFSDKIVSEIMTPRSMIVSINSTDFLGPLRLDDLHKTGHSRLPVIDQDLDHIVGVLHISNLLALDVKKSTTAEKTMDPKVFYIRQDQTLGHALSAFIRTRHHLFIVVNQFRETVGLLSLEDVVEALIGRKIVDEFDKHDDLRAVALRNPNANNRPGKSTDV